MRRQVVLVAGFVLLPAAMLAEPPGWNDPFPRLRERGPGEPNPFVDPQGWVAHVDEFRASFEASLERQRNEAGN